MPKKKTKKVAKKSGGSRRRLGITGNSDTVDDTFREIKDGQNENQVLRAAVSYWDNQGYSIALIAYVAGPLRGWQMTPRARVRG